MDLPSCPSGGATAFAAVALPDDDAVAWRGDADAATRDSFVAWFRAAFASFVDDVVADVIPVRSRVSGCKFNDLNGNGARDAGEPGVVGCVITAYWDEGRPGKYEPGIDERAATATTDAAGYYEMWLQPSYGGDEAGPKYFLKETTEGGRPKSGAAAVLPENAADVTPYAFSDATKGYLLRVGSGKQYEGNDFRDYKAYGRITAVKQSDAGFLLVGWTMELQRANGLGGWETVLADVAGARLINPGVTGGRTGSVTWEQLDYGTYRIVETPPLGRPAGSGGISDDIVLDSPDQKVRITFDGVPWGSTYAVGGRAPDA